MKQVLILVGVVLCGLMSHVDAQEKPLDLPGIEELHPCRAAHLGVELLCSGKWTQEVEPNAVVMVIREDPAVLLTVGKSEQPVTGMDELTDERIGALGQYEDGFTAERVKIGSHEAVKVQGVAKDYPEIRLLDFYVIHDYTLYSFLFSVNPKEDWDNYAVLFGKIAQSIKIPDRKP
jgi:hypothetical protein